VLKESFKIYCALNDGIINLVDLVLQRTSFLSYEMAVYILVFVMVLILMFLQFFDMTKLDAVKALDIYRRTGNLVCITAAWLDSIIKWNFTGSI